jgi:hypothetical protein
MLHGADREICWTDMLLVKFSSYSEVKGTVAKDMLQGADREICWTGMLLVKGSSYSKKKGTDAKDMLHGADREICWTDMLLVHILKWKQRLQKICYTERIEKSVEQICY